MRGWWWLSRWVLVLWGVIIRNVLVGLLLGRLGKTILATVGSSAPLDHPHAKHARDALWRHLTDKGANGDDPLPMLLYLVLNRKGDEIGKYLRDGGRTDALEGLGLYEAVLGAKVCQHFEGEKCTWRLRACSSFSSRNASVYRPRVAPNSGTLSWWINLPRRNSRYVGSIIPKNSSQGSVPSRCSGPQLRVGPEVFGTILPRALGETVRKGDGFSRSGQRKRTLPSSSSKQNYQVILMSGQSKRNTISN
ncbi:hypothetical protein GOBAR_AA22830 [Gossypium barbadense]|uniref:Uncharacterized protein n=1 Tax=Gossypium barbadense TaxID=3634 RepID=A0A2P5X3E6_GOSBA|nr:hypothetical protein GOBAR_AA22830 [Gossypium barbadense]